MKAAEMFAEAERDGVTLQDGASLVLAVPGRERPHRVWLGRDGDRQAAAYLETVDGVTPNFSVSQVLSVQNARVVDDSSSEEINTAKVTCHEPALTNVFHVFIDEILERLLPDANAVKVVSTAASEWRSLLKVARSGLSETAAAGLYGELRFLRDLVSVLGPTYLDCWQRRSHDVHNFISSQARVEVKTSSLQSRSAVTIHGLRQLDVPQGATLTLAVAEVQSHGDETIDSLAEQISAMGVDRELLVRKLADVGYVRGMPDASTMSFSLLSWRFWEIDEQSAVLNRRALTDETANAISNLSYVLNLSALGPSSTPFEYHRLAISGVDA